MIMKQILTRLEKIQNNKELLRKTCKHNQLPITMLNGFTNSRIQNIYQRLLKHYRDHPQKAKTIWFQNELKIFFWIVLSLSCLQETKIKDFEDEQWLKIQNIFYQKDLYTFKYETKRILLQGRKNSRVWNSQQNKLLEEIMSDSKLKNKWNQVARIFYSKSDHKYFRTGKQCRQHWLNHLDPSKKHGKWNKDQDIEILNYVLKHGKKWSFIAKEHMTHRTEHMIKNRYKALIFKQKKKMVLSQVEENKMLRRLIRKIQAQEKVMYDGEVLQVQNSQIEDKPLKTEIQIPIDDKSFELSVLQKKDKNPLNNFSYQNMVPWVCFMHQYINLVNSYQFVGIYNSSVQNTVNLNVISPGSNFCRYKQENIQNEQII